MGINGISFAGEVFFFSDPLVKQQTAKSVRDEIIEQANPVKTTKKTTKKK